MTRPKFSNPRLYPIAVWATMTVACASARTAPNAPARSDLQTPVAGAGEADITPTPGFPTGGYGPAGAISRGHWTRLKARAFYFRDTAGRGLMLVSVDTFAVSGRLHRDVATALARRSDGAALGPESLILAATHTHHGPGNFLSAPLYNGFGSAVSGHSPLLERYLREGILKAAEAAIADARNGGRRHVRVLWGSLSDQIQLNRSPRTFVLNHDRTELLARLDARAAAPVECPAAPPPGEAQGGWDIPGCPRLRAVNRRVHLVQILEPDASTVRAAAVFLALHPTALAADAPLFSADLFGIAGRELERTLSSTGGVIVGFFNGAEGDIVTRRKRRDILDVVRLGRMLGGEILRISRSPQAASDLRLARIENRMAMVEWRDQPDDRIPRLASSPFPGVAALGGAEGDRTRMFDLGFREGVRRNSLGEHGVKQPALDLPGAPPLLTRFIAPRSAYPQRLPVTVAVVDQLRFVTLPFEASTAAGLHIEKALGAPASGEQHIVIGLANEYASYMATADEYEAQDYMGASTMWGPQQSGYFEGIVSSLASAGSPSPGRAAGWFSAGARARLGPHLVGDNRLVPDAMLERLVRNRDALPARDLPQFTWAETYDGDADALQATAIRRVRVLGADGRTVDDDTGYRLLTLLQEAPRHRRARWNAVWLGPLFEAAEGRYYFEVTTADGSTRCSEPFEYRADRRTLLHAVPCS